MDETLVSGLVGGVWEKSPTSAGSCYSTEISTAFPVCAASVRSVSLSGIAFVDAGVGCGAECAHFE